MSAPSYRPEIDGLRSVAVMSVILYHAGVGLFAGGFVGVDIFFVISGFLITRIIRPEVDEGRFSFVRFYERRVRRIFPALAAMLLGTALAGVWLLTPGQLKDFGQSLVACNLFLANAYFYLKTGYFGRHAEEVPLLHTWSLSVEEQFYLVFPVLLLALTRWAPRQTRGLLAALGLISLALCLWRQQSGQQNLNFFDTSTRAWELLAGVWLALGEPGTALRRSPLAAVAAALGLLLLLVSVLGFSPHANHPGWQTVLPVLGSALVIGFADPANATGRLLASRPLVAIGLISYSAYLWHQPLLAMATAASGRHPAGMEVALMIAATLLIAWASWRWVEAPFRDARRTGRRTIWWGLALGSLALTVAGAAMHLRAGFPGRYSAQQTAEMATAQASPERARCHTEGLDYLKPAQACRYLDTQPVHWAVLGDSHAVELGHALAQGLQQRGLGGLLHLSSSGCQPAYRFDSAVPGCSAWLREAVATLQASPEIRDVVLVWRHGFYLSGEPRTSYPELPQAAPNFLTELPAEQARAHYMDSLEALVLDLSAAGKTVHLLDPIPELARPVEFNIYAPSMQADPVRRAQGLPLAYYQARQAPTLATLARLASLPGVRPVHSAQVLCPQAHCLALADGQALYFDDNHLSVAGAARLVPLILGPSP